MSKLRNRVTAALRAWRNPLLAAKPEEGVLHVQVPLREAMATGAVPTTLESRARLINYATSAAAVAVSQTLRERFPVEWEPERLARIRYRQRPLTELAQALGTQPDPEFGYSLEPPGDG